MADYECFPLWGVDRVGNVDPEDLPLSDETKSWLERWAEAYDQTLNRQDPLSSGFATQQDEDAFESEGKALWNKLKDELGSAYHVLYYSQRESKLLG